MSMLDQKLKQAVQIQHKLNLLPPTPRLSAKAFVAEAMRNAGIDESDLDGVAEKIEQSSYSTPKSFLRTLTREVAGSPNYPRPPTDASRVERAYGSDNLLSELNAIGVSPLQVVAVAAKHVAERQPERFGTVSSWERFDAKRNDLERQRREIMMEIEKALTIDDLEFVNDVPPSERDRGLVRIKLKNYGCLFTPDWSVAAVAAAVRLDEQEQRQAAEKLERKKRKQVAKVEAAA